MNIRSARFSTVFIAGFIATACASSGPGGGGGGNTSAVELYTLDPIVAKQRFEMVRLQCPWELENSSSKKASVGKATWRVKLDEITLSGEQVFDIEAAPGASSSGIIEIEVELPVNEEVLKANVEKRALFYNVSANFDIGIGRRNEIFEAEWNGEIYPPRAPQIFIKSEAARFDESMELNFRIALRNRNPFGVMVDGVDYVLTINGVELLKGELASSAFIDAASEMHFELNRFIGRDDHFDLVKALQSMQSVPYQLDATLRVAEVELKSSLHQEIIFPR